MAGPAAAARSAPYPCSSRDMSARLRRPAPSRPPSPPTGGRVVRNGQTRKRWQFLAKRERSRGAPRSANAPRRRAGPPRAAAAAPVESRAMTRWPPLGTNGLSQLRQERGVYFARCARRSWRCTALNTPSKPGSTAICAESLWVQMRARRFSFSCNTAAHSRKSRPRKTSFSVTGVSRSPTSTPPSARRNQRS